MTSYEETGNTRFEVLLANHQRWVIYSSSEIIFTINGNVLEGSSAFTGSLRAAGVWESGPLAGGDIASLDSHAARIPTGGRLSATVEGDMATMEFLWTTEGEGELLMMALPHHQDTLTNPATPHTSTVLKGKMVGYSGDAWTFEEPY